jgi:hypothetical protein
MFDGCFRVSQLGSNYVDGFKDKRIFNVAKIWTVLLTKLKITYVVGYPPAGLQSSQFHPSD